MNIRVAPKTVPLFTIDTGKAFKIGNRRFLKVADFNGYVDMDADESLALSIGTGSLMRMDCNTPVIPIALEMRFDR